MTWPWAGTLAMSIDDIWRPLGSFDPVPVVFITMARESIALRRPYRSNLRARQAEQTRTRIIAAAAELFAADGYARTTLAKIAAAAGVSTETVQGQGAKAALMIAAVEYVSVGVAGEESVLNLDLGRQLLAAPTVGTALDIVVDEQTAAHERSARLAQALIGAAAVDSELDRYLADLTVSVTGQSRRILEVYRGRGWLRTDLPFDELVETTAALSSVDVYLRITHRDGWSVERYRGWLRRMLAETVYVAAQDD